MEAREIVEARVIQLTKAIEIVEAGVTQLTKTGEIVEARVTQLTKTLPFIYDENHAVPSLAAYVLKEMSNTTEQLFG